MKWTSRKPNARVRVGTFIVCVIALLTIGVWVGSLPDSSWSYVATRVRDVYRPSSGRSNTYHARLCYLRQVDGKIQVVSDLNWLAAQRMAPSGEPVFEYSVSNRKHGFLAPTSMDINQKYMQTNQLIGSGPERVLAFTQRWKLGFAPDEEGFVNLDARLLSQGSFSETRVLASGHAVNSIAVIASLGILWSLASVPTFVRAARRKGRIAAGLCPLCKYDVCATPGRCPECGWWHADEVDEHARET